jgi:hypothetical protein
VGDKFEHRVQTICEGLQIWSPSNVESICFDEDFSRFIQDHSKSASGRLGEYLAYRELRWRQYDVQIMPEQNKGYDLQCMFPQATRFVVEAKCSRSMARRRQSSLTTWRVS